MQNLFSLLINKFEKAAHLAFPETEVMIEITQSTHAKFGHYQCNSPMKLAKPLQKSPRAIAEQLVNHVDLGEEIEKLEIAGPGFINITFKNTFISKQVDQLLRDSHLGVSPPKKRERIVIDFSSPNVAKEMHVGHLRSTIIGDSLARTFEFLGHDVVRLNHIGDWGTAFGMLIAYMKEKAPTVLTGQEQTNLSSLVEWYKASKKQFDEDPEFKKRAQLEVVNLQGGQKEALHAWHIICAISQKAYQEIYDLLDVKITERGESFYNPYLPDIVADLEKKGLITLSDGAKCIFLEGFFNREQEPLPLMIQKSDGGYNYDTTDMAAMRHRINEEKADRIIIITDAGQSTHFQMIFKAAEKAGYLDSQKVRVDHVPFGLVLGSDGKKFKTRSGETEKLIDLLKTAVKEAYTILTERSPEMEETKRQEISEALGIGAIKYADLSNHRLSDYTFSYERMLKFEGNTAAFLMYAFVRIEGIKRKIHLNLDQIIKQTSIRLEHPSEVELGLHLLQFSEILDSVSNDLLPNRLADYLYGLADKFNAFFRDCRVEGSAQQNERSLLCEATSKTLKTGLELLGVHPVDRM